MDKDNKLQVILAEQDIAKADLAKLVEVFGGPFEEAGNVLATYKDIVVIDEKDTAGMKKAREARLLLKKARTTVENSRKLLKADIVKQGRAIDSVARYVKDEIEPAEKYLQLQEDFAKIAEDNRKLKLKNERIEKLKQYTNDLSLYDLDNITPDQFKTLLNTLKTQYETDQKNKAEAAKKAEEERKAEEKRIADQAKENERLKAEAEEANKKIAAERAEREKLEKEKRDREAAELKARQEEAARKEAELAAPDKQKLASFANALKVIQTEKMPVVSSDKARQIVKYISDDIGNLIDHINEKIKEL